MRILIVEDETRLAETLRQLLEDQRYQVDTVYDGADGVDYGLAGQYDLIILDVMLPKVDGFQVAQRLRAAHVSTPILMLTARDDVSDKISGLDCGADDYMTKPFDTGELMARVRALTRRSGAFTPDQLTVGDLTLDRTTFELSANGSSVRLGNREYQLLELLMRQQGRFLSTEELMERIWGYESEAELSVVWAYISYLRRKLEGLNAHVRIAASRGRGYMLEAGT